MAINLPALLKMANFPKEKIDGLVKNMDFITEDEKYRLADQAWYIISQKYYMLLSLRKSQIMNAVINGKKQYNANDIEEVKAKLIHDLMGKLETTETESSIEEIRMQLEKFKTKPMTQDSTASAPPSPSPPAGGSSGQE